jgi:ferredoxin-NADP reductase
VLRRAAGDAVFYVCGPVALIEAVRANANRLGIPPERVQHESFD